MSVRYQLQANDAFFTVALQRHYSQHSLYRVFSVIRAFGFIVFMLCSIAAAVAWELLLAVITLGMALFIPYSRKFDHFCRARIIRKSPHWNEVSMTEFSDEGLKTNSNKGNTDLTWQAFTRALRFSDGFLLYKGPNYFHWLPDSALVEGSNASDAEAILRENLTDFRVTRS
jgi:hypothetical protein